MLSRTDSRIGAVMSHIDFVQLQFGKMFYFGMHWADGASLGPYYLLLTQHDQTIGPANFFIVRLLLFSVFFCFVLFFDCLHNVVRLFGLLVLS